MSSFNPDNKILFNNNIVLNPTDLNQGARIGELRYNESNDKFEGRHKNADVDNQYWRPITQSIATPSSYGVVKVGSNLLINESSGYLTSITEGKSRLHELIISVSPQPGAGDYSSIVYAISNVIGTLNGGYIDGNLTQSSNLNAAPNPSNSFIIMLAPGIYNEPSQILLPSYVSLIGEGHDQCIIKSVGSSSVDKTLEQSSAINCGSNSFVKGITIQLDCNNTSNMCGIFSRGNANVLVQDVKIDNIGNHGATSNCVGIYLESGGTDHKINNYTSNLFTNSTNNYGVYLKDTQVDVTNSKINISTTNNNFNYGIYLDKSFINEDTSIINNTDINISGANKNYGVYFSNSSGYIKSSRIAVDGYDTDKGYGIGLLSQGPDPIAKVSASNIISFSHSSDGKDTINSSDTSSVNFITAGFTRKQKIKVSGAAQGVNNNYFTIYDVSASSITLIAQNTLVTESASTNSITIMELYSVDIIHSEIEGSTNSIIHEDLQTDGTSGFYSVESSYNRFLGGESSIGNNNISFRIPNVITVAPREGDFNLLSTAINSIVENNFYNRYVISVMPGIYYEPSPFSTKEFISIIGSGVNNSIIKFNNSCTSVNASGGITLTSNVNIDNLSIVNETTGSENAISTVLYSVGSSSGTTKH